MRLLLIAVITLSPLLAQQAASQDPERKHISISPLNRVRGGGRASAATIERGARYPSVIHLKGNVEIRTNGFILLADEADYNEETGEVDARGNVKVKPYPPIQDVAPAPAVQR